MARLLVYLPVINDRTALHFSSKGDSWKLRDYSTDTENVILSNQDSDKSVEDILSEAKYKIKADGTQSVTNVAFWKGKIREFNEQLENMKLMEFERDYHDPIDLAINNDLESIKENIDKSHQHPEKIKTDSLKLIEDILKIEKIGKHDRKNAVVLARRVIENIIANLCDMHRLRSTDSIFENIDLLSRQKIISEKIKHYFHFIRLIGNIGGHDKLNDKSDIDINDVIVVRVVTTYLLKWYLNMIFR